MCRSHSPMNLSAKLNPQVLNDVTPSKRQRTQSLFHRRVRCWWLLVAKRNSFPTFFRCHNSIRIYQKQTSLRRLKIRITFIICPQELQKFCGDIFSPHQTSSQNREDDGRISSQQIKQEKRPLKFIISNCENS